MHFLKEQHHHAINVEFLCNAHAQFKQRAQFRAAFARLGIQAAVFNCNGCLIGNRLGEFDLAGVEVFLFAGINVERAEQLVAGDERYDQQRFRANAQKIIGDGFKE